MKIGISSWSRATEEIIRTHTSGAGDVAWKKRCNYDGYFATPDTGNGRTFQRKMVYLIVYCLTQDNLSFDERREANIARNAKFMQNLGFHEVKNELTSLGSSSHLQTRKRDLQKRKRDYWSGGDSESSLDLDSSEGDDESDDVSIFT